MIWVKVHLKKEKQNLQYTNIPLKQQKNLKLYFIFSPK